MAMTGDSMGNSGSQKPPASAVDLLPSIFIKNELHNPWCGKEDETARGGLRLSGDGMQMPPPVTIIAVWCILGGGM